MPKFFITLSKVNSRLDFPDDYFLLFTSESILFEHIPYHIRGGYNTCKFSFRVGHG
jgi:hypothetical protein